MPDPFISHQSGSTTNTSLWLSLFKMETVNSFLRAFELADSDQREKILRSLVDLISDEEATTLDKFLSHKKSRYDILGNLPVELTLGVFDYLELRYIYICAQVCPRWRNLLQSETVVDHLLSRWLPLCHINSDEGKYQQFSLAVRRSYLRATGRFRSRITVTLRVLRGTGLPFKRFQTLHQGCIYKDVTCTACPTDPRWDWNEDNEPTVTRRYAAGRLAWQRWSQKRIIYVHDLSTNKQTQFVTPSQSFLTGNSFRLFGLGNKFVLGVSGRTL